MVKSSWSEESKKKGRELEGGVERWIIDHLRKKHGEQGWNTVWRSLIVTCVKP